MTDISRPAPLQEKSEYHVASFVTHVLPDSLAAVQTLIKNTPLAEIHATTDEGKIVFTLEGDSHKSIGIKIDEIRVHKGILNLSPVYHQYVAEGAE